MSRLYCFARPLLLALLLVAAVTGRLAAQQPTPTKQRALSGKIAKQLRVRPDATPDFININRIPYFEDKKALKAILKAEKRKNWTLARTLLEQYVAQFGIENFYRNNMMLWRLGQLFDRAGNEDKAKAYYRLALKHYRQDVTKIQQYYDSLEQKTSDLYVPLKVYYDIVEYRKNIATFKPPKGVYTNMGPGINSDAPDYGPSYNDAASQLIFSSKRKRRGINSQVDEDLYLSRREGQYWSEAEPLPKPINSPYNEGSACLSKDGTTIYFARCECPTCHGNCDLFVSRLKNGQWTVPQSLGMNVNSTAWDSQPTLSRTEDTLYFASDRIGGFGLSDIWFTYKLKNGQWAPAKNLGPTVNTRESEVSPYYHPLYNVLYFSSRGQLLNFGDFDIYKTYRVRGRWQEPINIGPLVNGKGSEYYFTIDGESKNLYYARSETSNLKNLDLYSFPLPMEAQPLATTHVSGSLVDSLTQKPLSGIISIIDVDNGIEVASKYLRPDGSFDFDLIDGSKYIMLIQSPDYFTVEKKFDLAADTVMKLMTTSIDYNIPLIFQNLEFEPGKSNIRPVMHPILDRIVVFLADHPTFRLRIAGHTDAVGIPEVNEKLSQDRADAIRRYIEQKGKLAPNRIESFGYGSTQPIKEEVTEEDRRTNRRVEFRLLKPLSEQKPPNKDAGSGW